jgi:Flp pilus assembly protein TadG
MRLRPNVHPARRRAAAAVEFAVVVPHLLMFLLGIVEYGRLLMAAQITTNGSREGARYAVQADTAPSDVSTYTRSYLTQAGIPAAAVTSVTTETQVSNSDPGYTAQNQGWVAATDLTGLKAGTPVRVRVVVNFDEASWLPTTVFVSKGSQLTGTTVMRKE